ncbi:MAG TPA: metallophosphoesterase family protein [Candidatus Hydrogenedentes bacterium]|nr:metallophosphoesterase family protein [Candidatus Hydrogenedentota bacterium]
MSRANALPLSATFALVTGLSVLTYSLSGGKCGFTSKLLIMANVILFLAAIAQLFFTGNAKTSDDIEEPLRKAALITAGPYLQNMQKTSITILWETTTPLPGKVIVSPRKEALLSPEIEQGDSPAEGQCITVESPSVTIHEVTINNLAENTPYYYRVVSNGVGLEIGSFRTAYEGSEPFDFVVYGDSQEMFDWAEYLVRNRHKEVCNSILTNSPQAQFVVHVGDMTFLGNEHERWIREFFGRAGELIRNTVVWPVIGNHELNASWYFDYFSLPNADEHYYSFDYGNSRFIVLAVEGYAVGHEYGPPTRTPMEPGSPQYEWLKKTLENSQDKTWRFVFFHQSPFASGIEGGYTPASKIFEPLFEQYHVNAVFSGHDHLHEVSIKDNIVYIVTGGGGGPVFSLQPDLRHNPYSCYFKATWHHCNVHIADDGFEIKAIDLKGRVFHSVKVIGNYSPNITLQE